MSTDYIASRNSYTAGRDPPSPVSIPYEDWTAPRTKHRESIYDEDRENGSNMSSLDSRRITPTLHASVVSEILNLRRQLESKDDFIDHLEVTLQSTKSENELLEVRLAASERDVRSGQWEAGKLQTHLEEVADDLAKERDSVTVSNQELREKLDLVTKKSRDQEKDFATWQQNWEAERRQWEKERQELERSLLLTEDRLRVVVDEFSSQHVEDPDLEIHVEANGAANEAGIGHPTGASSINFSSTTERSRPMSALSSLSNAWSVSVPISGGHGYTLADELAQEGEDDHGLDSPENQQDEQFLDRPQTELGGLNANSQAIRRLDAATADSTSQVDQESGDRASVLIEPVRRDSKAQAKTVHFEEAVRQQAEIMVAEILQRGVEDSVSAKTQKSSGLEYRSSETQTDQNLSELSDKESMPLIIPSIAIHPPLTAPSTPRASVLPPATRNALCQTDIPFTLHNVRQTTNAGVQTEDTPADERKVAPLTSALIQNNHVPVHNDSHAQGISPFHQSMSTLLRKPDLVRFQTAPADLGKNFRAVYLKAIDLPRPVLLPSPEQLEEDATGPTLHREKSKELRWSRSISPLSFREITARSDTETFDFDQVSPPEDVFSPDPLVIRKGPINTATFPMTAPKGIETSPRDWRPIAPSTASRDLQAKMTSGESSNPSRPQITRSGSRETLASSTFGASSQPPPVPVPTRSSSRMYSDTFHDSRPTTAREDESPTSRRTSRRSSLKRPADGIRTDQAAGAMPVQKDPPILKRRKTPSLAPIRASTYESVGQSQFLLINNLPTAPEASTPINNIEHSIPSSTFQDVQNDDEGLVDNTLVNTVAMTMIGGWMWKYVNSAKNGDIRHKRWVWLSPYERTIMWSLKQPTTEAALMGKSGRKLQIKSVLDVKDNHPPPKGETSNTVFDRSIIVLTPSRALKLTAPSRESHYHWLMALSFLANPSGMPPQVPRVPELEANTVQNEEAQQPIMSPVTAKPINKAQVRNFSEPTKTLSLKASLSRMVTHEDSDTRLLYSHPDPHNQPHMQPLENYNRHSRKRSSTGPSRFTPSIRSSRSLASIIQGSIRPNTSTTIPRPGTSAGENPGTVRMTAFVDTVYRESALHAPPPLPAQPFAPSEMVAPPPVTRSRRNSQLSTATMERRRSGRVFDVDEGEVPFGRF
ncbi:hypothetical protein MBLNU457_2364t1 [Dothideomycetes sp. NU457]